MRATGFTGFLLRWLMSILVVFGVYNTRGHSLFHLWFEAGDSVPLSIKVLYSLLITVMLVTIIRVTLHAINLFGLFIVTAIVATVIWVLSDLDYVTVDGEALTIYFAQVIVATALALGMTLGNIQRKLA
jgi:hypothetical protein